MPTSLSKSSLLFTDLDGTLLTTTETIAPKVVGQLRNARARGVVVVPATARGIRGVVGVADMAELGPLAVCHNGAVGYDLERQSLLWIRELSREFVRTTIEDLLRLDTGLFFAASSPFEFRPQRDFLKRPTMAQLECELEGLFELDSVVKVICRHRKYHASELIALLSNEVSGVQLISGSTDWVEIVAKGVSKGFGVGLAAELLGIELEDVVAVGDHLNDLPMLAIVGHPFAVANAHASVLAMVEESVASNDEGGVGELVDRMGISAGA
ncbi:HAD family hydrolase [Ferrimicrobium acidiphilum]|uniref:Sugar phosphatase YidA n=1 Tax=Ferrimicrobium acidiphilum DSM 19497 TaxID=1121877 RepID=A0A0D8FRI6_9ACTN|nr:HAD family hydrolase [Ferrimicrobium acidiphilum]KJE75731.1 sugar phosphatase YidA [Ferrimicrobium acidiphilum DSM 19497]